MYDMDALRAKREICMNREMYEYMLSRTVEHAELQNARRPKQAPIGLQQQVFLYYLATSGIGGSYHAILIRSGNGDWTSMFSIRRGTTRILDLLPEFVQYSVTAERKRSKLR